MNMGFYISIEEWLMLQTHGQRRKINGLRVLKFLLKKIGKKYKNLEVENDYTISYVTIKFN